MTLTLLCDLAAFQLHSVSQEELLPGAFTMSERVSRYGTYLHFTITERVRVRKLTMPPRVTSIMADR